MVTHTYLPDMQSHQNLKKCVLGVMIVSEPDPQKIEKEGLVNRLAGVEVYTAPGMKVHFRWLLISIMICVYWKC